MKQMKTLTLNETMYEIVDESGRNRISELEKESANLSTKIDEQINPLLETVNNEINSLKENYDTEIVNIISTHTEDIETLTTNIDTKITNPEIGTTGYVLSIKAVDESGKPTEYEAVANSGKTAYQYAQEGGYTGTEEEFLVKLAQENPTKVEFEGLRANVNALENNLGGYSFYNNPEIIVLETKEIYSPDGIEYILSESEEGMKLLEDTKKYESMLVIMLVVDNTIYYNSEGISPIPNSEEGEVLLEDTETYYTAEVVILKTYEEYKTEDDKYILADSITGKELIATDMGSNKRYTTIVKEGNYYRIAGADSVIPFSDGGEYSYSGIYYYYTNTHITNKECLVFVSSLESSSEDALNRCDIEVINGKYTQLASGDRECSDYQTINNEPVHVACKIWHCIPTSKEMKINLVMNPFLYMIILERS